jgi:acyl transferase domain-containing protein/acyl carrier protein
VDVNTESKNQEVTLQREFDGSEIAIVGMSCRFPGAGNVEEFWANLCGGRESLSRVSAEDLRRGGLDPAMLENPQYVPWAPFLDDIESFDAGFFGYTSLEAKLMDPQQRLFLECAWEAFEHAGYLAETYRGRVGVFTGAKTNTYLLNLFSNNEFFRKLDTFQIALGNDLACMATRVSYKIGLQGPSYAVHTACSTSLVTVHLACQSLLLGECDMALAGGAAINVPQKRGYLYQKGGILSPDGHCRTFDEKAEGSNFGNGVGAVVLKRLADAVADGDRIWAVVRGSAVNNDGANKASYTAPGVEGQTKVLLEAMANAGVDAETISYIEAHGTATDLGDSIEMLALTQAFRATSKEDNFCAIGSVKTNIGHLETAAGIAGLIKTALALHYKQVPPSLHFERPNPKIDFAGSPFYVNTRLSEWKAGKTPRRAGVSSFGIGSTNAHVILEEAPAVEESSASRPCQLLLQSARSEAALDALTAQLVRHFHDAPAHDSKYLADAAYTLNTGRKSFTHRRALLCRDAQEAAAKLESLDPARVFTHACEAVHRPVVFLLPGLGDHYPGMGADLYANEPAFRRHVDHCAELLRPHLKRDIRETLFPKDAQKPDTAAGGKPDLRRMLGRSGAQDDSARELNQTFLAQPATFVIEYALAQLWMEWGVRPQAMIGYSLGEYVAACLAGVLSLEAALALVAKRAMMIQELPVGAMLAVPMSQEEVAPLITKHGVALGAVNGPSTCVLSGPVEAIQAVEKELAAREVITRRLQTTHAFHSRMMEPLAEALTDIAGKIERQAPRIPFISNTTGTWFSEADARDPGYWARHMARPVLFDQGIKELIKEKDRIFLEVGAGQGLTAFFKQHPLCTDDIAQRALPSLPSAYDRRPQLEFLLESVGKLWLLGQNIDWKGFYANESRRKVPLPTYPFERQRYWVDPPQANSGTIPFSPEPSKRQDIADWFYQPVWRQAEGGKKKSANEQGAWIIFSDNAGLGAELARSLRSSNRTVITVHAGESFSRSSNEDFVIRPAHVNDYFALITGLGPEIKPAKIVHLWSVSPEQSGAASFDRLQDLGFYSLVFLTQALGRHAKGEKMEIEVITNHLQSVDKGDRVEPEKATILGPVRVIPQEFPEVSCRCVDLSLANGETAEDLCRHLLSEFELAADEAVVAYRNGHRWTQHFEARPLVKPERLPAGLRENGVYLITGGSGGLGLAMAEHLAKTAKARLVLTGRSALPDRAEWPRLLADKNTSGVAEKIRALQRIEEAGGEVLTAAADAGDEAQMRRVVDEAIQRFGEVHGVIHMAGVPGGGIIQLKTREMAERILAPKVKGTLALEKIFAGRQLDFLVLYSSIASVLGEVGQADYCGASAFLDAYAQKQAGNGPWPVIAINWEIWQEIGIGVNTEVPAHIRQLRQQMLANGIMPAEGMDAFDRILSSGIPQVIVCPQELEKRIELGKSLTADSFLKGLGKSHPAQGQPARRTTGTSFVGAGAGLEQRIAEIWQRILGREQIGIHDNFFDLGGNSLLGLQLVSELSQELGTQIAPVTLFEFPTVRSLTRYLNPEAEEQAQPSREIEERRKRSREVARADIAIIGTAGRFPGARNVEELWKILCEGKETVSFFTDEELLAAGVDPAAIRNPRYVRAASVLEEIGHFDATLFGYSPREAEVMDPQHRIFLECAWEVLERAGYDPHRYPGLIGVFAGANLSTYLLKLYSDSRARHSINHLQALIGNDKDSLTTTVSYKLNLRGPSMAVQTFCSTSLVAVHMACQSLRQGECDMTLAGGIRVVVPDRQGYIYEPGGLWPADGHTRSFDAKANGSPFGNGVGLVCLKRLEDALADGDHIEAVIKGTAINNDGAGKAGYTAPSVRGQSAVIQAAFENSGVDPETIGYVEAHGSATELGDPIEISALTKAFAAHTEKKKFCPIGSVKSNFGHLDRAAGVTALIKTTLALQHQQVPPSINFQEPNPNIDFENSPFFVNTSLRPWSRNGTPRRAGVNSLGVGGTNVHVIVEEAPEVEPSGPSRPWQLLVTSGKSEAVLDEIGKRLAAHLEAHPELELADAAFTLQVGRKPLEYRRIAVCRDREDAGQLLRGGDPKRVITGYREEAERRIIFMFPGIGAHYADMARGLYESEAVFREAVDHCCELLMPHLGFDLRKDLYPEKHDGEGHPEGQQAPVDLRKMLKRRNGSGPAKRTDRTDVNQPLLFVIEYALARLWMEWGIKPQAMIGYSLGEYVAACLAGVTSLEDSLKLVAGRARLIQELPAGALLAVALTQEKLQPLLGEDISLMAINAPEQCVVSGPVAAIEEFERKLTAEEISCRRLEASHAFHSRMMQPIFEQVAELARNIQLNPPQIPYISNVTGKWIEAHEATSPEYWARHMCQSVQFSQGVQELLKLPGAVLVEMGPPLLSSIVLQGVAKNEQPAVVNCLRHSYETQPDMAQALQALGKLWLLGVEPDWKGFYAREKRRRVLLPPYPFQRQRYWIETRDDHQRSSERIAGDSFEGTEWFYTTSWKRTQGAHIPAAASGKWWIFTDPLGLGGELARQLEERGGRAVRFSEEFARDEKRLRAMCEADGAPEGIVYLCGVSDGQPANGAVEGLTTLGGVLRDLELRSGFPLWIVGNHLHEVTGDEPLEARKSALLGASLLLARELQGVRTSNIDIAASRSSLEKNARQLMAEIHSELPGRLIAYRGGHRWLPTLAAAGTERRETQLRKGGAYLMVNALGPVGERFAAHLAQQTDARLALADSLGIPDRELWDEWLEAGSGEGVISEKIRKIRKLEAATEVLCMSGGFSDDQHAKALIDEASRHFGTLDGVIYFFDAQGPTGETLESRNEEMLALDRALQDRTLDFRLLVSSMPSAKLPGDDVSTSFFLDHFAAASARGEGRPWTSVTWLFDGSTASEDTAIGRLFQVACTGNLVVSPEPLSDGWNKFEAALTKQDKPETSGPVSNYPRPNLRVAYAAPATETETTLAQLWRDLLGVKEIGIHDNFLELGGDSLMATRLISRMKDVFHQDLAVRLVFEASTIAELAGAVDNARAKSAATEDDEMEEMMKMLEQLSEEEVEQELLRRKSVAKGA